MKLDRAVVKLVKYGSPEYLQACQLRYELFFAEHNLPLSIVYSDRHTDSFHAAILIQDHLVAYGELVPQANLIYRICQMVVHPNYQKQNLGRKILLTLIDIAKKEGAIALTLNSRLTAIGFYQKLGFYTIDQEFPSCITSVMHIKMNKIL